MFNNAIKHSLILLSALFLTLLWVNNPDLSNYSLQLSAGLIIFLVLAHKLFKTDSFLLTESTISVICVTLITSATAGLTSPLFFLNHFLLFELSLLLEPSIAVILTFGLMVFYLYTNQVGSSPYNLAILLSLLVMTPLALLLGKVYQKVKNQIISTLSPLFSQ
ncbi:hypothetical protein A2153_01490 [Candidatus Gottesmanbacteria bacterium RBG_16_38_7b]|uniref:Metal-dependent phosphohydrolase 7TM intracellular domain-containing protein n=1 Tax=Candidatus Gottesmanbacteria bacterium RBG_16_38_7b TaxID=1798372 RepID=A0A1F5YF42_9BACT|nr:MAG: hypothetical protein A2153_01490 [Candidatus Gottesmanbacteria bacterium RBG_16_38_7b]